MDMKTKGLLQSLMDMHDNPSVVVDEHYVILAANRAYGIAYGIDPASAVGRHCYEVLHHRDTPCHLAGEDCPHKQVLSTGQIHEVLHTHFDHKARPEHVSIKGHPIQGPDGRIYLGETIVRLTSARDAGQEQNRLIGRSNVLLRTIEHLSQAASSDANVLIQGESGVGKELAAHHVHNHSRRKAKPFVVVDCAALPDSLFEAEIFGHERGAYTGSVNRTQGLFELADSGTLFLDEAGEIPLAIQAKLLRVLETGEFRRLGGRTVIHTDARIVAATNRALRQMVAEGRFREDLYYRLACITIDIPPLRERRADIPLLVAALLEDINRLNGRYCYLTGDAMARLMKYDFPGNVRELRNILQRSVALCRTGVIDAGHLQLDNDGPGDEGEPVRDAEASLLRLDDIEARYIRTLIHRFNGNRRQVAATLGISERTLYRKLTRYGLR
ncbi:MAG: sigma 54-interacting transcriptional regulator [Gammaproteobacteria bacterium]|jgi:two-component system, NtrC family, response regulator AtoC